MKYFTFIISIVFWSFSYSQSTSKLQELLLKIDTISIVYKKLEEEEILCPEELNNMGLSEFCYAEHTHYPIKTTQQTVKFLNSFDYQKTEDIMFCGFDYILTGYSNKQKLFIIKINSECNYAWSDIGKFYLSNFRTNKFLKLLPVEYSTTCYFKNYEIMRNYIINQKQNQPNESLKFIKCVQNGEFSVNKIRKIETDN